MNDLLFVYGTLMENAGSEMSGYLEANAESIGKGYFHGRLYDMGEYPAAKKSADRDSKVFGEIYRLKDPRSNLEKLDRYEEIGPGFDKPYLYKREIVKVRINGNVLECWTYLYNRKLHGKRPIPGGNYISYKLTQ